LGLEWAGVGHTVWQVERDPFCRQVLAKHWPDAQRFEDVREVGAHNLELVDVICGGFPCQDVSHLGKRKGMGEGTRSGLWVEYARIIGELRPRFVIVENVIGLRTLGLESVLGDLRGLGYRGEQSVLSACAVGAPHARKRLFIVAHTDDYRMVRDGAAEPAQPQGERRTPDGRGSAPDGRWELWQVGEPKVFRVANGVPLGLDRNKSLGNAVVPAVARIVGQRILALDNAQPVPHIPSTP
jgi:DNA (cytosine-5)-methyltransferase 1